MILSIIILLITILLYIVMLLVADDNAIVVWIGSLSLVVAISIFTSILETKNPHPSAIDVYRGKTTLEITYRDSVAVDSVVVYKLKKERK